ncbi:roadblock/LC7 domain-containing protein [Candidatus Bathyarchaeota archaeon]|nr:roadblock/LC7 domain-containing protein [Candidatus Bathyarchaeota archaeon]
MSSYYEKKILKVLEESKDGLTTVSIAEKANISKTTALKYLASLKAAGKIDYIEVGPAKLWRVTPTQEIGLKRASTSKKRKVRLILEEFKEIAGLLGSAVVDNDGLTIFADLPWSKKPERIGSIISRLLQLANRSAEEADIGQLKNVILEGERGRIVACNEGNFLLIAFSNKEAALGMIKIEIEESAKKIKKLLNLDSPSDV